jgi:predicted ATP-grasp superfamily ATP-dependent carboligase
MINKYIKNIPTTYYYNFDNETFINNLNVYKIIIKKPNSNSGAVGISLNNSINYNSKNCVYQKYISHDCYYVGHFLVLNGIIHKKIYFSSNNDNEKLIKCNNITNYKINEKLKIDDDIFDKVFYDLNYSGFASSDFIIHENNVIIFEINPRPGGSLIHNIQYFDLFIEKLLTLTIN